MVERSYYDAVEFEEIKRHLRRTPWGEFQDAVILSEVGIAKRHPLFAEAKSGDAKAAEALVEDLLSL
jgi:hypothetical protein